MAVAESCSADLGSAVLSDSDLMGFIGVVEGIVGDGIVIFACQKDFRERLPPVWSPCLLDSITNLLDIRLSCRAEVSRCRGLETRCM